MGRDAYENLAVSLASLFCLCSSFLIKTPILLPHKMKEYLVTDIFFNGIRQYSPFHLNLHLTVTEVALFSKAVISRD